MVFTLLDDELDVAAVSARCEGRVPQLSVQLVLTGFDPVNVLDGDTFVGTSPSASGAADLLLLVTLQVDQDADLDTVPYNFPLVRPAESASLTPGTRYTIEVPVDDADGTVAYESFTVSVPNC